MTIKIVNKIFLHYAPALIYCFRMKRFITPKEEKVLDFIEKYQFKNGASPTVKEMRLHMKLKSDGFVVHCLERLAAKGVIKKDDTPRGIKLLPAVAERLHGRPDTIKIPVLGSIPAGGPVTSEEYVEDWVSFPERQIKHPADSFILRVRGDSMIDAGIFEGDHVVATAKLHPKNEDIVIALIDGGSTVKRFKKDKTGVYLKAENPKYKNIYPAEQLEIQGVVIGLFRWY